MTTFFKNVDTIAYEGPESTNPLAYRFYDAGRTVMGKTMAEHLRLAVCYWHNFCWGGEDAFGGPTRDMPWRSGDAMQAAKNKADAIFECVSKLGVPYFTFHDADIAPAGDSLKDFIGNVHTMVDYFQPKMQDTGIKLLWGTANAFSHPRFMAGASTNPNPEMFAYAATQVRHALEATHKLGGENYVLWGGREGYDTLLNTDLKREGDQLARFLHMVVEHKYKIGFKGALLIEPKPCEPTKHQYDYDTATVNGFLHRHGLADEFQMNIEANHATLAGHSFEHEIATCMALDCFGSIDANRGDPQNGWDTDQFPNSVESCAQVMYLILQHGGFTSGGFNFDTKVRRQSMDTTDIFHGHIGGIDVLAKSLLVAESMMKTGELAKGVDARYAAWGQDLGQKILSADHTLESLSDWALESNINPKPVSGQQELLENVYNRYVFSK
jgi:xylose isomerase